MTAKTSRSAAPEGRSPVPSETWAAEALCAFLERVAGPLAALSVRVPDPEEGEVAKALAHAFGRLLGPAERGVPADWIVACPPAAAAEALARAAIDRARLGVALLVPSAFLGGGKRFSRLFDPHPPALVLPLAGGGDDGAAWCWIVWSADLGRLGTWLRWIPPGGTGGEAG